MQTKGLSGNALKVIAIIAMTIDHLAWVGIETYQQAETPMQIGLHCIGRLTAPMMIFFVAEGYYHTHDFRRYLYRLLMLAAVSHFAFCYFNMSGFNPLAILMIGRSRGNFYKQMLWMMVIITGYAVAFFVVHSQTYGMVHMACWLAVPLLSLYNGQRGRCRWLGKFFYYYYPAHMALIGLLARII